MLVFPWSFFSLIVSYFYENMFFSFLHAVRIYSGTAHNQTKSKGLKSMCDICIRLKALIVLQRIKDAELIKTS